MGESLKLGRMINFMVALRLGCKVGYASSDFDLNVKVVDYKLHHKMSVILVEMEVLLITIQQELSHIQDLQLLRLELILVLLLVLV